MPAQKITTPLAPDGLPFHGFVRLPSILAIIPISRATFLDRVKKGVYPRPYRLGPRAAAWKVEDVRTILASFEQITDDSIDGNVARATAVKAAKRESAKAELI